MSTAEPTLCAPGDSFRLDPCNCRTGSGTSQPVAVVRRAINCRVAHDPSDVARNLFAGCPYRVSHVADISVGHERGLVAEEVTKSVRTYAGGCGFRHEGATQIVNANVQKVGLASV